MKSKLENKKKDSKWGGNRKNAGRKKGSKNGKTLMREQAMREYRSRVAELTNTILDRELQLAMGCSYLYRIEQDEKGKKQKPELVTDELEIRNYLEGKYDNGTDYYYITTERPDLKSMQDMLDRTYGKAMQSTDITSGGEKIMSIDISNFKEYTDEELQRALREQARDSQES